MRVLTTFICWIFTGTAARADFGNYNSVLLGYRASGMGGAYVAMTEDPSATSFYNPAALSRAKGASLSASASLYNKYDTTYTDTGTLLESTLKINRGSFQAIPAAAGQGLSYGTFAIGVSVITPDYTIYNGDIGVTNTDDSSTYLNLKDQSLWVGGNFSLNLDEAWSAGFTAYYSSRDYSKSYTDQKISGGNTDLTTENKNFTSNNILYILGVMYKSQTPWKLGASFRFPSIQLSGEGTYHRSHLDTASSTVPTQVTRRNITAHTIVPPKLSLGASYEIPKTFTFSTQIDFYGALSYQDLVDPDAGTQITHDQVTNISVGGEYFLREWLAVRGGLFTNYSSHPDVVDNGTMQNDHVDMLGFSANIGVFRGNTSISFGGYFTGGRGRSTFKIGDTVKVFPKTEYVYSMLLSSSYYF